ncbi:MAG: YciI family protein [Dehalococcoidia bacterium]
MANYLLVYKGGGMGDTPEEQQKVMQAWMAWFGGMGPAVVDGGNPCGPSRTIKSGGAVAEGGASALSGYSVIKADSLDEATKLAKGCPVLAGNGSVEVYETFNAM